MPRARTLLLMSVMVFSSATAVNYATAACAPTWGCKNNCTSMSGTNSYLRDSCIRGCEQEYAACQTRESMRDMTRPIGPLHQPLGQPSTMGPPAHNQPRCDGSRTEAILGAAGQCGFYARTGTPKPGIFECGEVVQYGSCARRCDFKRCQPL